MSTSTDSASQPGSRRQKHSRTSASETSSITMRDQMKSFHPVPSIEKQLISLESGFKSIKTAVEKSVDVQALISVTSKFNDGLTKIINDSFKVFTNSFRRGNQTDEGVNTILDTINDDMDSIQNIFIAFRKVQKSVFLKYIGAPEKLPVLVEFCVFVEQNAVMFITEFWNFCTKVKERAPDAYDGEVDIFGQYVTDHYSHLNELQIRFIRGVNDVDLTKDINLNNDYSDEEETVPEEDALERGLRQRIGDSIRDSYKMVFPIIKKCWHNEFKWELESVLSKKGYKRQQEGEEDENEIQLDLFIYDLFDSRLSNIEALYNMALTLDNDEQAPQNLIDFIRNEASKSFSDQLEAIRDLWTYAAHSAPLQYCSTEMAHFGYVLTYYVKSELQYNPTPESLGKLGDLFRQAEELKDLQTAQELLKLLNKELLNKITQLEELYKRETQLLNSPPKKEDCEDLMLDHKDLSDEINELAMQIAESIRLSEAAAFIHRKNDPNIEEEDEEEEDLNESYPMKNEIMTLTKINPDFNEKIHSHIIELRKQLNDAYEGILTNSPYGDSLSVKSGRSKPQNDAESLKSAKNQARNRKRQKMINDALSMCSKVSKSITLSSSNRDLMDKKDGFRTQIELIEEAICRTYEQLFASTRSLIVKAIRDFNQTAAESCNDHLSRQFIIYLRHLEVLKKWYIEEMKVEKVKYIEDRMEKHQGLSLTLVDSCLKESFEEIIEKTVMNYLGNVEDIKDEYQYELEILDSDMVRRMDNMAAEVHIKELEIIEHQYRIEMKKEKGRSTALVTETEDRIRTLLSTKQFEAAKREQDKLEKLKVKEWEARKKEIKKKYDDMRKKKLEHQARDLKVLEDSFDGKKKKLEQSIEKQLEDQNNMLMTSVSRTQQSHIQFAKVLSVNGGRATSGEPQQQQLGKKTSESPKRNMLVKEYEDIAKRVFKEYKIEGVSFVKQKLPDFAVKARP